MFPNPYQGVPDAVRDVLESLIHENDFYHQTHKRRLARTLQIFMELNPRGRVLELGTEGLFPLAMKELAPQVDITVTNFDMDQGLSHEYSVSIGEFSGTFKAFAIDLESDAIPEKSATFDFVLCCEVLEHMDVDPMFMMSEVNRVMKKNGTLLLTTPNVVSSRGLTKMLSGYEPYFYMQYHRNRSPYRHNYEYSIHSLKALVKASGFSGNIWTEDTFEPPILDIVNRLNFSGFSIQNYGDNLIANLTKVSDKIDRYPHEIYV